MRNNRDKVAGLTGIRGVASVWVVLFHAQMVAEQLGLHPSIWLLRDGWTGVDMFFMLSGFVLMLGHHADFEKFTRKKVLDFLRLRFFRVYPLSTVVLIIILALVSAFPGYVSWYRKVHDPSDYTVGSFFRTLLLATRWVPIHGDFNQPVWSLSLEIIAYCVFPMLAYFSIKNILTVRASLFFLIIFVSFPILVMFAIGDPNNNNVGSLSVFRLSGFFTAGVVLYRLYSLLPTIGRNAANLSIVSALSIILISATIGQPWLMSIAFAPLIFGVAAGGLISEVFNTEIVQFLGRISFPLYLVHVTPLLIVRYLVSSDHLPSHLALLTISLSILSSTFLAWLLHKFVERPSHEWARRNFPMRNRSESGAVSVG